MKKLNLLAFVFALLMGVSFTSCLNSDSDPYNYGSQLAKMYNDGYMGGYYFKTSEGITITPTAESMNSFKTNNSTLDLSKYVGQVMQISYRWNAELMDIPADATEITGVEMMSMMPLNAPVEIVEMEGAQNDSVDNAAVISLEKDIMGYTYKPYFFDETTLVVPVEYYMSSNGGKLHYLSLAYYPNEVNENLTVRLKHNSNGDYDRTGETSVNWASMGYLSLYYKVFDLMKVYHRSGVMDHPVIDLVYNKNSASSKLDDSRTEKNVIYSVLRDAEK